MISVKDSLVLNLAGLLLIQQGDYCLLHKGIKIFLLLCTFSSQNLTHTYFRFIFHVELLLFKYWNLVFSSWQIFKRWWAIKACLIYKLFKCTSRLFTAQDIPWSFSNNNNNNKIPNFCELKLCSLRIHTLKTSKGFSSLGVFPPFIHCIYKGNVVWK